MRLSLFFLTALLTSGRSALAQHMNAIGVLCQTGPESERTRCFISEARVADGELNAFYGRLRKVLTPADLSKLRTAQRLWIQYRDANCAAEREPYDGGSAAPMVYAACVVADTRQRSAELNTMYGWRLEKFEGEPH
jgi:uncharacterized protein YecT (DUF1311 family)